MNARPLELDRLQAALDAVAKWLKDPKLLAIKTDARTGKPPSEFDHLVEDLLSWWHGGLGRRFTKPYKAGHKHKGHELKPSDLNFVAMKLLEPVIAAVVNGEGQKLRKLGNAVVRVHRRCSGSGKTFRIHPAKPVNLRAIAIAEQGGASAEDIYQALAREFRGTSRVPTERHLRRIAAALHVPPANKGGYRTRRP